MMEKCCQHCGLAVSTVLSRYRELIDRFKEGVKNLAWVQGVKRGKEYLWVKEVLEYWEVLEAETEGRRNLLEESRDPELQLQDGAELVEESSGYENSGINQAPSELSLHSSANPSLSATTSIPLSLSGSSSPSTPVPLATTQTNINMPPPFAFSANSAAISVSSSQSTQSQQSIPNLPTTNSWNTDATQVDLPPSYLRSLQSRYRRHLRLSRAIRSLKPHLSPPCLIIPPFQGAAKLDQTKGKKGYGQSQCVVEKVRSTGCVKDQTTTRVESGVQYEATKEGKKEPELPFTEEDMILERLLLAGYAYADLIEKTEKELTRISFELDGFSSGLSSSSTSGTAAQAEASSSFSLKSLKRPRNDSSKLSRDLNLDSAELSSLDLSIAEENEYILDTKEAETKRFFKRLKVAGIADEDDDRFDENEDGTESSHGDISQNSDVVERGRVEDTEAIEDDDQDEEDEEETVEDDDPAEEYDG
ncbi:hypothetical protein BKA69DRAFT_624263 [Paraphysoderma sedebokerense]|nr:hypothetical protein BKA69DRAFT_624263 [Paraphysoderma sedebokerense]